MPATRRLDVSAYRRRGFATELGR